MPRKLLLVHHFPLPRVSGVTVMVSDLLQLIPAVDSGTCAAYQSFEGLRTPADLTESLDSRYPDAGCVVGVNLHIEVQWELSLALFEWCERRGVPAYVYVHDYWPHHRENLRLLAGRCGARLLAATPFILETLGQDAFEATLVMVGVPLGDDLPAGRALWPSPFPRLVASGGRLVPRKRFPDIVRAFCQARLDGAARLYLRLLPSLVYPPDEDDEQFRRLEAEVRAGCEGCIHLHRVMMGPLDYDAYSAYVCASGYEGFSMTPIEAARRACPPIMSDIPAHRAIAGALFGDSAAEFLYPMGDHRALAELLRDEIATGWRRTFLAGRLQEMRATIESRWSLRTTARMLAFLSHGTRSAAATGSSGDPA